MRPKWGYFIERRESHIRVGVWFTGDFDGVRDWQIETIGM